MNKNTQMEKYKNSKNKASVKRVEKVQRWKLLDCGGRLGAALISHCSHAAILRNSISIRPFQGRQDMALVIASEKVKGAGDYNYIISVYIHTNTNAYHFKHIFRHFGASSETVCVHMDTDM